MARFIYIIVPVVATLIFGGYYFGVFHKAYVAEEARIEAEEKLQEEKEREEKRLAEAKAAQEQKERAEAKKREERAKRNFTTGGMSLVEMREALAQAIDALPKRQREVMVLRYWEGCSFEDIAARLKLPLTGVWRLHLDASMHLHRKIGVLLNPGQSQRGKDNA